MEQQTELMSVLDKLQQKTVEISEMAKQRAVQQEQDLDRRYKDLSKEERLLEEELKFDIMVEEKKVEEEELQLKRMKEEFLKQK